MKVCWVLLVCCLVVARWPQHAHSRSVVRGNPPPWLKGKLPPIVDTNPSNDGEEKRSESVVVVDRHAQDTRRRSRSPPQWLRRELPVVVETHDELTEDNNDKRAILDDDVLEIHAERRQVPPLSFVSPFAGSTQKLCFDCDTECQAAITTTSVDFYFYTVTAEINQKFAELLQSYWVTSGRADQYRQSFNCDVNILVGKDAFFNTYNDIAGITYFMSLCTMESVVVEKLLTDPMLMASGLAHEIGHMVGIVHTGDTIGPYYVGKPGVEEQCPDVARPLCGTEQNMRELCIMVTALPSNLLPNEFSDCSKSQVKAFHEIRQQIDTTVYPYYRNLGECVPTAAGNGEEGSG